MSPYCDPASSTITQGNNCFTGRHAAGVHAPDVLFYVGITHAEHCLDQVYIIPFKTAINFYK